MSGASTRSTTRVELVGFWGSDEAIVSAARTSTDGAFRGWGPYCRLCSPAKVAVGVERDADGVNHLCPTHGRVDEVDPGDEKLLAYLWKNEHHTPFEMAGARFEVEAPIFVFREWHRHRTQSYNELSGRYVELPAVDYLPDVAAIARRGGSKKGMGGSEPLDFEAAAEWRLAAVAAYRAAQEAYERGLKLGVSRELARIVLPVARFSRMMASANLRNWLAFLKLRNHPRAMEEIRFLAAEVEEDLADRFPRTLALFREGRG